jgi:hypothetical protein
MNGMKNELSSVNWQLEFKDRNVEQCWEIFKTRLIDCSEKYIPTRTVKGEKRQKWITREIIKLVRKKKDCGVVENYRIRYTLLQCFLIQENAVIQRRVL